MERRIFHLLGAVVVLLAFAVRQQYLLAVELEQAMAGDAGHYINYAYNMLTSGYFGAYDVPDAYRPPGYPALIALVQLLDGNPYLRLLQWQVYLGTASVAFTIALARQWLPPWASLLAGLLLALWPHHIAFTAEVLSEVLFGFLLVSAMLVAAVARDRAWWWLGAGFLFACASMVNPVCTLLPLVVAVAAIGRKAPRHWIALLAPVVVMVGGWSLRPADGGSDRAWKNLVQGSHAMYHEAYVKRLEDPRMMDITTAIEAEMAAMIADPPQGLRAMASRLAARPGHALAWYASKPWLLWDWDIRIGPAGGPYMHVARNSTLEAPPLREVSAFLRAINPALFGLSLLFALCAVFQRGPARMVALAFLYFTAVHVVLQAEPRYSIPYRPLQMVLAASAIAWLVSRLHSKRPQNRSPVLPPAMS